MMSYEQLGKIAYEAWAKEECKVLGPFGLLTWSELDTSDRESWTAAAKAVAQQIQSIH